MTSCADLRILFRAAAGARRGLDHLVRCRSLARVLGVHPLVSLRGSAAAEVTALALGCEVVRGGPTRVLRGLIPDVLVIDEPVAANAQRWMAAGRRAGCLVVSVHEPGLGCLGADVVIDGSVSAFPRQDNAGARFARLDPSLVAENTPRDPWSVLVALGGGPRAELALDIAQAIVDADPRSTVRLAGGFVGTLPRLRERIALIESVRNPRPGMSRPRPADVGAGDPLSEACVPGILATDVPFFAVQQPMVAALAGRGARITSDPLSARDAAEECVSLMGEAAIRRHLPTRADS
jgi:hypothetical protein